MRASQFGDNDRAFLDAGQRYVSASTDIDKTVRELVRIAAEAVGSSMGALYLLDDSGKLLKPAVVVNLPEEYVRACGDIPLGEQCCGRAVLYGSAWYIENVTTSGLFSADIAERACRAGVRAAFSIPVVAADGRCLGSLSAHFPEPHVPSEFELERHRLFAQLIAFALTRKEEQAKGKRMPPQSARSLDDDQASQAKVR